MAAGKLCFNREDNSPPIDEYMKNKVERQNNERGHLNDEDGYNCEKCKNRGYSVKLIFRSGMWYEVCETCDCMKVRHSIARMKLSGLENTIKAQRLSTFNATNYWQEKMLEKARAYIAQGAADGDWFFIGGQSGAGKTHICTGIARELLYQGREVRYIVWEQVVKALKAIVNEPEYGEELGKLERAEVLYIDDLFKPINEKPPTDADLRVAFELINYRYVNKLPTIISSERYLGEIMELDEATGGRIYERSRGYTVIIERNPGANYRKREMAEERA